MAASVDPAARLAPATQFKVLAQVFPVLRHEVLRPVSNASLAVAMLQHVPGPDVPQAGAGRRDELLADLEILLGDSVQELRRLGGWLEDGGATTTLGELLVSCRRLVFTQLLRSRKQIVLPDSPAPTPLREYSARYVLLAWLLGLLETLPEGARLCIDIHHGRELRARGGDPGCNCLQAPTISVDECHVLARHYGWQAERDGPWWILRAPSEA
ncbi:hypothetical protein [Bordetella sp. 2513F-2]